MDLYLDERDRAEGLWRPFRPVRHFAVLLCNHFFYFCWQAFP